MFAGQFARALMILRACEKAGVSIPEEIALVSNVEHTLACENTFPPLSTLSGEHDKIALEMCRLMDAMLKGETPPAQPVLVAPSGVIERRSSNILAVAHLPTARAVKLILDQPEFATVGGLAASVGITLRSLDREFRKHVAMSPGDYIRTVRMQRARDLLEKTGDTLAAIARQTGYGSGQALYFAFKRAFGITPGQYRRRSVLRSHRRAKTGN
jgi:LacI family transcriptional regulator